MFNNRRRPVRLAVAVGSFALVCVAVACGSDSSTSPTNVSLKGTYTLSSFSQGGVNVMPQVTSGTAVLTDTTYKVNIVFSGQLPAIVDSGSYTAKSNGTFTESSLVTGAQSVGTYTNASGVWTVSVTSQGVAIAQTWNKVQAQP